MRLKRGKCELYGGRKTLERTRLNEERKRSVCSRREGRKVELHGGRTWEGTVVKEIKGNKRERAGETMGKGRKDRRERERKKR